MVVRESLSPLTSFLVGGIILATLYLLALRLKTRRARHKIIKQRGCEAPPRLPLKDAFFGVDGIYDALRAARTKTYLDYKRSHYALHGNTFSYKFSTLSVISTIEPENIKTVLSTAFKDYVVGAPRRNAYLPLLGNSIVLADGAQWEHSRALLRPSFARSQVSDLSMLDIHVENLIRTIPRDGSTVDLGDLFLCYTADVTTDLMFGESIQSLSRPEAFQTNLMRAFRDAQAGAVRRFRLGSFARFVPQSTFYQAVKQVHTYVDAHINRAIKQHESLKQSLNDSGREDERYVFLHELLKVTGDGEIVRNELVAIFFAGRDTTSALLSNLFFVLARNPRIWQRLRDEVNQLQGRKPTLDELKTMKYLGSCLNEALRLYPVVPASSRVALRDTVLPEGGGVNERSPVFVAAGSLVVFHYFALHQRKDLWGPDADEFRPERWQNEKASWVMLTHLSTSMICANAY
ncbi:hypothetical protein IMSHALPRED_004078 [Imshaugia aleurites]|uniref:Cytochrome P450 n=1 Tax=Imshaugia aleurites TaxID=172621 RepID=A0A8H3I3P2_9LECA|nr:hypothetical protein IMSHALPRED_004078 [Imshaugia aleurites]